jgi:putative peptidoglycan lipid II flippase
VRGRGPLRTSLATGVAVLALAGAAVPATAAATAPARAPLPATAHTGGHTASTQAQQASPVAVDLVRVTPTALGPTTTLTAAATVRNTGTSAVTAVTVTLRLSRVLATRAEVARWAQGDETIRYFTVGAAVRLPEPLAPGAVAPVSLSVAGGQLGLDARVERPEARGLEVHVTGQVQRPQPGTTALPVARVRSFVVWQPQPVERPVQLALLAPITGPVAKADAGSASAHAADDWSPSGRLSRLLHATAGTGFSYVLDPALLSAAAAASGTTSASSTGTGTSPSPSASPSASPSPSAGPGQGQPDGAAGAARDWLQLFATTTRHRDLVALPWADPDVAAVAHADGPDLVDVADTKARATVSAVLGQKVGTILWPAKGRLDTIALHALTTQADRPVVLDGAALPADALEKGARVDLAVSARRRGTRVVRGVVADPGLDRLVASGGPAAVPQILADLAVTAASTPGQDLLVTAPRDWDPDATAVAQLAAGLRDASWVSLRSFSKLAGSQAPAGTQTLPVAYSRTDRRRELPPSHVAAVAVAERRLEAFAPALDQRDKIVPPLLQQALSLLALGWRGQDASRLALARTPFTGAVDALYAGISIDPGSTKNLLAKEGSLPITVRNTLLYAVHVRLVLIPRTGQLDIPEAYTVFLQAGTSQQVPVKVRAVANGDVSVVPSFRTPDGKTQLYQAPDIQVRVRPDWEGRGVVVVALLLGLLLAVGLFRGARRGRPRIPPEAVPDPDDVGRVPVPEPGEGAEESTGAGTEDSTEAQGEKAHVPDGQVVVRAAPDPQENAELSAVPVSAASTPPTLAASVGARTVVTASAAAGTAAATLPRQDLEFGRGPATGADPASAGTPWNGSASVGAETVGMSGSGAVPAGPVPPAVSAPGGGGQPPHRNDATSGTGDAARGIVSSSAIMAAGTLLSRVLGMVRVVVLAWAIGAAFSANAFSTANTLPNQLFLLIGGGVLNAVLVPQIVGAMRRPDGGQEYVDRLLTLAIGVLGVATVVVTAAAPLFLWFFTSNWHGQEFAVAAAFAFWCMPQVFFYGLYTVLGQVLNARGSFGPYMWAPVVNNVVAIAGMLVFVALYGAGERPAQWWTAAAIAVLAGTTTLGVVAQALVLIPVLRRSGFRWRPRTGFRGVGLRSAGEVASWTVAALVVGQLGLALLSQVANRAGDAAGEAGTGRFVYDTAFLLFMLPHSLVAVSVVTAVFTRMSEAVVAGRLQDVRSDLSIALRTTGVATVLATVAFAALGPDLTAVLFATNNRATTEGLAWTTTAMVVGLVPFSAQYLFQRVFYAFTDARTPFWVQVLVVTLWSAGNLFSGWRLHGAWVVVGIGASMSLANIIGAGVTVVLVRRRVGSVDGRRVASLYVRCALAAAPAGLLAWTASAAVHLFAGSGTGGALLALLAGSLVVLIAYLAGLKLLRVRELDDLAAPLRRFVHL